MFQVSEIIKISRALKRRATQQLVDFESARECRARDLYESLRYVLLDFMGELIVSRRGGEGRSAD